jgi:hypothetical protein
MEGGDQLISAFCFNCYNSPTFAKERAMRENFPWLKWIGGYLLFLFFHQIYDLLGGGTLGAILGEGIESVYAHMKMLFYAYLLLSVVDYFRFRQRGLPASFLFSRMLILAAVPWMMIIVYYAVEALGIVLPRSIDLTWALVVTAFGLYFSIRLEESLDEMPLRPALQAVIVLAFVSAFITYVGFSFQVPDNFFIAVD